MSKMAHLRHEFLSDLASQAEMMLIEYGIEAGVANQLGGALADHLAIHWGGQVISIPKDHFFNLAQRDVDIWNEFDGSNHVPLSKKHGISVRGIYKVIKRVKTQQIKLSQSDLFD